MRRVGTEAGPSFSWGLDVYHCPKCKAYVTPKMGDADDASPVRPLTKTERVAVAETMAARWKRWAENGE